MVFYSLFREASVRDSRPRGRSFFSEGCFFHQIVFFPSLGFFIRKLISLPWADCVAVLRLFARQRFYLYCDHGRQGAFSVIWDLEKHAFSPMTLFLLFFRFFPRDGPYGFGGGETSSSLTLPAFPLAARPSTGPCLSHGASFKDLFRSPRRLFLFSPPRIPAFFFLSPKDLSFHTGLVCFCLVTIRAFPSSYVVFFPMAGVLSSRSENGPFPFALLSLLVFFDVLFFSRRHIFFFLFFSPLWLIVFWRVSWTVCPLYSLVPLPSSAAIPFSFRQVRSVVACGVEPP